MTAAFQATSVAVIRHDHYVGGYAHAAAGHSQDLTEHMFGTTAAWSAWIAGYEAGVSAEHPSEHLRPWCVELVTRAEESYQAWVGGGAQ